MNKKIKVLVEANKVLTDDFDGTARYVGELLRAMQQLLEREEINLSIEVFFGHGLNFEFVDIRDFVEKIDKTSTVSKSFKQLGLLSRIIKVSKRQLERFAPEMIIKFLRLVKRACNKFVLKHHRRLRFEGYDVVHLTQPQSYLFFQNCTAKMVTTVHDLTHLRFPQFHLDDNIDNANRGMHLVIEKNSGFIAVSNATRDDLLSYYPELRLEQIRVIHEACDINKFKPCDDHATIRDVCARYKIAERPYFLSLSTLEPRKNLQNSIKAFLLLLNEQPELEINFVIAGKIGWMQGELLSMAKNHGDRLIFIGFVDDADLAALYSGAVAFSYVSFYEGFGLPPLEAMSCGVPVVYGNNSSMIEVVGDGGLPADPNDIVDIKEKFKIMAMDKGVRENIARIAQEHAYEFSWGAAARETLDVYKKIADSSSGICQ